VPPGTNVENLPLIDWPNSLSIMVESVQLLNQFKQKESWLLEKELLNTNSTEKSAKDIMENVDSIRNSTPSSISNGTQKNGISNSDTIKVKLVTF